MIKLFAALALSFSLSFSFVWRAAAQSETPPPSRTGTVYGQIANGTQGGEIPGDLAVMLHAWDEQGETVMLDSKADASGMFREDYHSRRAEVRARARAILQARETAE